MTLREGGDLPRIIQQATDTAELEHCLAQITAGDELGLLPTDHWGFRHPQVWHMHRSISRTGKRCFLYRIFHYIADSGLTSLLEHQQVNTGDFVTVTNT
jgi:hypothetical protein